MFKRLKGLVRIFRRRQAQPPPAEDDGQLGEVVIVPGEAAQAGRKRTPDDPHPKHRPSRRKQ